MKCRNQLRGYISKSESKVIARAVDSNPEKAYLTVKPNLSEIKLPNFQLISD